MLGELLKKIKALSHLGLSGNKLRDEGVKRLALGQCRSLSFLNIASCDIGPVGATHLGQCKMFSQLGLSCNTILCESAGAMAGMMEQCPLFSRARIDLGYNGIQDAGAGRIATVLGGCASLSHIDLRSNNIGDQGARSIAVAL